MFISLSGQNAIGLHKNIGHSRNRTGLACHAWWLDELLPLYPRLSGETYHVSPAPRPSCRRPHPDLALLICCSSFSLIKIGLAFGYQARAFCASCLCQLPADYRLLQATTPNKRPTPAVSAIASEPQKVTLTEAFSTGAPPARAAMPPNTARKTSDSSATRLIRYDGGTSHATNNGSSAPVVKVAADESAAWLADALQTSNKLAARKITRFHHRAPGAPSQQ